MFGRQDIPSTGRFVERRFVNRMFGRKDVSSTAFWSTDVLSNGRLVDYFSLNTILLLILFDTPNAPVPICFSTIGQVG